MKHILCYGDSNTWGHDPADPCKGRYSETERWPGVLERNLGGEAKVIEEGMCGRNIMYDDPAVIDRNGMKFLNCCICSHKPLDVIIIMLGTNDTRPIFSASAAYIAKGMVNLVNIAANPLLYENGQVPLILVVAPPPVSDNVGQSAFAGVYDETSVKKSRELAAAFEKAFAGRKGVYVLDAGKVACASEMDCVHMDKESHRKLGEMIASFIAGLWKEEVA